MTKTGIAFGDYISIEQIKKRSWHYDLKDKNPRNFFLLFMASILLFIIFIRLFYVQVINGAYYKYLSDSNRVKKVVVHAPRGVIFDRNGTPLTFNIPGFREVRNGKTILISEDEALKMIANGAKDLEVDSLRQYPYKEAFAHVLGYIGQISKEELKMPDYLGYKPGDLIGKMGIEQYYEQLLRGIDGDQLFEVDATGKFVRKLGQDDPVSGRNITTTLDQKLQVAVYDAMKNVKKGSVIVSTPKGEILAMVSKPTFDPNLFTMGMDYKISGSSSAYANLDDLVSDYKNQPFLNRSISGVYPPGSTFKLIVAAEGLTDKIIDENWIVEDTGVLQVGSFSFSNWYYTGYGGKDGEVNVVKGIKRSNDIFFYKLAEKIGVDKISKMAFKFGLDKKLGIDLHGEESGTVPTQEWKLKAIGEQWYLGDTYHYGIGQGFLLTTPLQVSGWTQGIANGGVLYQPHLLKDFPTKVLASNLLDQKSTNLIREGMIQACSPTGVAWPLFDFKVNNPRLNIDGKNITQAASSSSSMRHVVVACKTGTAEAPNNEEPHAWITLFAPAYNPQVVVTVLSENSGEGSNIAAPIAKKVLDEWFGR